MNPARRRAIFRRLQAANPSPKTTVAAQDQGSQAVQDKFEAASRLKFWPTSTAAMTSPTAPAPAALSTIHWPAKRRRQR